LGARQATAILGLACALALLLAGAPGAPVRVARADGGAPNLAYVVGAGAGANDMAILDIGAKQQTGHVTIGGKPHNVVLSFDARFAYVTQQATNTLAIVDAQAKQVVATLAVGTQPSGLAIDQSASDNRLFVANTGSDSVTVIDPDARRTLATIPVGHQPTGVGVAGLASQISDPSSSEIWVTNSGSDSVTVISAGSLKVLATIPVTGGPESIVIPQTGGVGYVGTKSGAIVAVGVKDHLVLGTLFHLQGGASGLMDYDAISYQVYVPDPSGDVVQVLRPAAVGDAGGAASLPDEPVRTLPFDGGPAAVAIPFDGVNGFVAARDAGRVTMLDIASRQIVATFDVGGAPVGMVTGSYPPLLNRQSSNIVGFILTGVVLAGVAVVAFLFIRADRRRQQAQQQQAERKPPPDPQESMR
jgi:YVTN family beta-propeller protein